MTTDVKIDPIIKKLTVPRDAATAFAFYTSEIDKWWPKRTHSIGQEHTARIVMEAKVGGRMYEVLDDGTEKLWGTVLECEPGRRIKYSWHLSRPPELSTFVEIDFEDHGNGTSTVTLTHSNWQVLGEIAEEARSSYNNGWEHVLGERFGTFAKTGKAFTN